MAAKTSKTARRSMPSAGGSPTAQLGGARMIVPCNGGRNAYVRNPAGTMPNLSTSSEAFIEHVRGITAAGFAAPLRAELVTLEATYPGHGWAQTLTRLEEAGALSA